MSSLHSFPNALLSPPVYETAMAVQFEELSRFRAIHFGLLYQRLSERYPVVEDHPRSEPIVETFPKLPPRIGFAVKKAGPERVWYRDKQEGNRLLQVQPDRFGLNWRRNTQSDTYDRFENSGPLFLQEFEGFKSFALEHEIGKIQPNLVEIVYVNHVFPEESESTTKCMDRVLTCFSPETSNRQLEPEFATFNRVYRITNKPGRLYVEAGIGRQPGQEDFVLIKLTSRIALGADDDLEKTLQAAHDILVDSFFEFTTDQAKAQWNRKHDQ